MDTNSQQPNPTNPNTQQADNSQVQLQKNRKNTQQDIQENKKNTNTNNNGVEQVQNQGQSSQQEEKKEKQKEKEKTITLTVKQMNKISKQLQKLQSLKKQLESSKKQYQNLQSQAQVHKKQNIQLRDYITALQKKYEENKKTQTSKQAMQETIKHLQRMVDQSSKNEEKAKKQQTKYKQFLKIQKQMASSLKAQVQDLRRMSSEYFLLKQQVSRLGNQCVSLRQARDEYPIMVKKYEESEAAMQKLKHEMQQKKKQHLAQRQLKQKLQNKLQTVIQTNKQLTKQKNKILCDKQQLYGQLQAVKQQLQDDRLQIQLREKKFTNEIKQLKITLHQQHEKLKITQHQLEQARKNAKQSVDLDKVKLSSLEKEDLFNLLQQSEMKLVSLKMAINDASQNIHTLNQKIKDKDKSIMALARQLTKDYPNMEQSQGMQYIQKDIIEMGKMKKQDWGEIVEKVMIQNLRLKSSVTALGQQYNSLMRSEMSKQKQKERK